MSNNPMRAKAAEVDEWIKANAAAAKETAPAADTEQPDEPEAPQVAIQPEAEVVDFTPEPQDSEVIESETDVDEQIAALRKQAEKADQRWRSLQGQIDSKDRQIEQLHTLIANMNAAPATPQESAASVPSGYTKADADAFGEDMIDLVERVARQIAQREIGDYKQTIEGLSSQVDTVTKHTARSLQRSFESELDRLAPLWHKLNEDQDFIDWLQRSPSRQNIFADAAQQKDAEAVADVFNLYAKLNGLDAEANQKKRQQKQAQLEKQLAPGKSRAAQTAASAQPEDKFWSRSEIAQVYRSKSDYTAEEFAKLERQIAKAMRDERVDYTK